MLEPQKINRRQMTRATIALGAATWSWPAIGHAQNSAPTSDAESLRSIEPLGMLFKECSLPGETRRDHVVPCHGSGIQVSRDRWLFIYSTHGFRGVDDERSIVYQLRRGAPDGPLVKEGFLAQGREDWDALNDGNTSPAPGKTFFKQHGHPVVFGVPKGAAIKGREFLHANLFVAKWRAVARVLDREKNHIEHATAHQATREGSQRVEWVQFRLNDSENDIEVVQVAKTMRQAGYETGSAFCSHDNVRWMNQSFVRPIAANEDFSEWADCNHFDGGRLAALKYRYNPRTKLYEWVETGPLSKSEKHALTEASLCRLGEQWVIAARAGGRRGPAWMSAADPFSSLPSPTFSAAPASSGPISGYVCADGVLRLFTGDPTISPRTNPRDPLYCWDIDPTRGFAASNRRLVFDSVEGRLPFRAAVVPKLDFTEVLPQHGDSQLVCHRVVTRAYHFPYAGGDGKPIGIPPINDEEEAASGIYYERMIFQEQMPPAWEFA